MAKKKTGTGFGAGNITSRNRVSGGVKKEDHAIANRPAGWSVGEARRVHRAENAREVGRMRLAGAA